VVEPSPKREEPVASYCQEKFEQTGTGREQLVCWRQDKHVHDASMIGRVQTWLAGQLGGAWTVRANSFMSNQSKCNLKALEYA
jgi:hypothetical protein